MSYIVAVLPQMEKCLVLMDDNFSLLTITKHSSSCMGCPIENSIRQFVWEHKRSRWDFVLIPDTNLLFMSLMKHFIHFKRVHVLVRQTTTRLVQKAGRIEMIRVFRLDALNLWELRCVFFTLDQLFKILCWIFFHVFWIWWVKNQLFLKRGPA